MTMHRVNELNEFKNDDPAWCLITEYSLSEDSLGEEIKAGVKLGPLYKTLRDLGVQLECLNKIEETITGIAAGLRKRFLSSRPHKPVLIRLFCQRAPVDSMYHLEKFRNGGWGYYLIERDMDTPDVSCHEYPRVVELYLYKEGE
jgi:hypothetical protein